MRLRRENGDFDIVVNSDNGYKVTINAGLNAEDLIGQIVNYDGEQNLISKTADSVDKATTTVTAGAYTFTYTKESGEFAKKS